MLPKTDLNNFLRDLVYIEEDALQLIEKTDLPNTLKTRIRDNIREKQVIVVKVTGLLV